MWVCTYWNNIFERGCWLIRPRSQQKPTFDGFNGKAFRFADWPNLIEGLV